MTASSNALPVAFHARGSMPPPMCPVARHRRHAPDGVVLLTRGAVQILNQPEHFELRGGDPQSSSAIISRMTSLARLSSEETALLRGMPTLPRRDAGQDLLSAEAGGHRPQLLTEGWACHQRLLSDGRRQIFDFILPGDGVGVSAFHRGDTVEAVALTPVVAVDAGRLVKAVQDRSGTASGLAEAVRQMGCRDRVRLSNQVLRLGLQTAYERLVHLILELHSRLEVIGLVSDDSFAMPVRQEALADAVGISQVHVNRTLQQIRKDGLFDMRAGRITLKKIARMQSLCEGCLPVAC